MGSVEEHRDDERERKRRAGRNPRRASGQRGS